jgi:arginyl-tRNA synthetase
MQIWMQFLKKLDANLDAISEEIRCKFVLLMLKMNLYGLFINFYLSASNVEGSRSFLQVLLVRLRK